MDIGERDGVALTEEASMRLLLVEDFDALRDELARGLGEQGYAVDATGDGAEAWWYLTSNTYDLVILDLMLPGKSGLQILHDLREQKKDMPVLVLTAMDAVEDRVRGLDLGADDYLTKPFAVAELLARVRSLVRRGHGVHRTVLACADLRIDTAARMVHRGGQEVALTPREFSLLEFLAMRLGEVVTRAELWEHLYAFESEATSNVLDAHVARLRRKISPPGLSQLIHTRRGIGYLLAEQEPAE
jgi:DNA-binding response OmpR family regulator